MLRLLGALFLILVGTAIGAQMCSGPDNPPPPSRAQVLGVVPAITTATLTVAPETSEPRTREDKLAAAKLEDQQNRTYAWDGGWLRLERLEFSRKATRAQVVLFIAHGDLFYVDLAGTALVAGPLNIEAVTTNFPQLPAEKPWQTVYRERLESNPGPRTPEATATTYYVDFPPMDSATVPERTFLKLRFWVPSERERSNTLVLTSDGAPSLQRGEVASFVWDTTRRTDTREARTEP